MKTRIILSLALLIMALSAVCQQPDPPAEKVDSLSKFAYQRQGDPFPFPSGVAIEERQYNHLFKMALIGRMEEGTNDILTPVPRTVYVDKEVRKKGDGNKLTWSSVGAAGGAILTTLIFVLTK